MGESVAWSMDAWRKLALEHHVGKEAKLERGAAKFTFEPRLGEGRLAHGELDEGGSVASEFVGHRLAAGGLATLRVDGEVASQRRSARSDS
jgi:hypothetical protein